MHACTHTHKHIDKQHTQTPHTCAHTDTHLLTVSHTHTYIHTRTCARTPPPPRTHTYTHKHPDYTKLNLHNFQQAADRDLKWKKHGRCIVLGLQYRLKHKHGTDLPCWWDQGWLVQSSPLGSGTCCPPESSGCPALPWSLLQVSNNSQCLVGTVINNNVRWKLSFDSGLIFFR